MNAVTAVINVNTHIYLFSECTTIGGPSAMPCIFPFTFRGETYSECKLDPGVSGYEDVKWCSTKVDENGNVYPVENEP